MSLTDLRPGDPARLGPYRLVGRLGAGGMGQVYLGTDPAGGTAALKTLTARSEPALLRMTREVAALAAVEHPRLPRLLGSDLGADRPWLAMEYATGPSLAEAAVPLGEAALDLFAQGLAEALGALHAAGIVHRDLKPANVVLTFDGPVLVDLGIALDPGLTALTQVGTVIGSPGWLAPEQLRGHRLGPATDVWGWAALVGYAATGRPVFGSGDPSAVGWRVLNAEPDLDGVPPRWLPPVRRALSKDPAARPPAASLPGTAARPAGLGILPVRSSVPTETIATAASTVATPLPARRSRRLGLLTAVAAAVLAAWFGGSLMHGPPARVPAEQPPAATAPATDPSGAGPATAQPVPADDENRADARQDSSGRGGSGHGSGRGSGSGGGSGGPGPG